MATKKNNNAATKDVAKKAKKLTQSKDIKTKTKNIPLVAAIEVKTVTQRPGKTVAVARVRTEKAGTITTVRAKKAKGISSATTKETSATISAGLINAEPEISDEELIIDFVKGNDISFQSLVDRYKSKVYSLAMRLTKNQEDAEEVLQDVFITVYRKIDGFEGKSKFSSWLYRITVNSAFMKLRKRKQERYISIEDIIINKDNADSLSNHIVPNSSEAEINNDDLRYHLETAISKLPPDYRAVYILRDIDELSNKEVSAILHIGIPAVKSRLHRSRLMLKKRLFQTYSEYKGLIIAQAVEKGKKVGAGVSKHAA